MTQVASAFRHPLGSGFLTETRYDADGCYVALEHAALNTTNAKYHLGEDWNGDGGGSTDLGNPVYAAANGRVTYAGYLSTDWGNVIIIQHTTEPGG